MQDVPFTYKMEEMMRQLPTGAFLTVQADGERNTMTIGWAQIGIVWGRHVLTVLVRDSRHTFGIIEKAADFTVSVPWQDMKKELTFCGTRSGRDFDKFHELGLKTASGKVTKSPVLQLAGLHYECRIVYKSALNPSLLHDDLFNVYPKKDFHTLYYGEIVACYETE
ncbi:flavin reductase family protein [bacterium]|nr:flavin reductase family protein [bacterium]